MKKIILPLDPKSGTWRNYSAYLNWVDYDIDSLSNYLEYFNPSFRIQNTTIYSIESNTKEEIKVTISSEDSVVDILVDEADTSKRIILPGKLKFREGYYNGKNNTRIYFPNTIAADTSFDDLWNLSVNFPVNSSIIRILREEDHIDSADSFQVIAQPTAGVYTLQMQGGTTDNPNSVLVGSFVADGQRTLGSELFFAIENGGSRYYSTTELSWGATEKFEALSVTWNKETPTPLIKNINGVVWSNAHPLMSECYIQDGEYEEFIFDQSTQVSLTNIANHGIITYNINATNISTNEIQENWDKFVKVFIL